MSDISDFTAASLTASPDPSAIDLSQALPDVGSVLTPSQLVTAPTPAITPSNLGVPLQSLFTDVGNLFGVVTTSDAASSIAKSQAATAAANLAAAKAAAAANPLSSPTVLLLGGVALVMVLAMSRSGGGGSKK